MKQLITRIDEELHAKLKARAAEEKRSVNSLVIQLLTAGVQGTDERSRFLARLEASGRRVLPPEPSGRVPSRDEALELTRGAGKAIIEALEAERSSR